MSENIQEKVENKIIDLIALGAGGRLVIFKPENSDKDLIVEKRGDYKKKVISFNIYSGDFFDDKSIKNEVSQLIEKKELAAKENFYLLFAHFDIIKQDISDNIWVIPSLDLQKLAKVNNFSKFLINKEKLREFLIEKLEKNKK